mmetsp:Transcript_17456/g.51007  ORF Transcript_17456/g.51007 Transcript_17456/m.51007 type:complete len:82 (-) Transcript_17456:1809-2054(-)
MLKPQVCPSISTTPLLSSDAAARYVARRQAPAPHITSSKPLPGYTGGAGVRGTIRRPRLRRFPLALFLGSEAFAVEVGMYP